MVRVMRVDIWSDIVCPWCYIGKRHLEQALARFSHASEVELVYRSFELDPSAPRVREAGNAAERLGKKYGVPLAQAQQMIDRVVQTAAKAGVEMRYDTMRGGNTFDGHRLLHLARQTGHQVALKERLMRGYFCEGEAIGEHATLERLACEVGLDAAAVRDVLATDRFAREVRGDEQLARELGISGVPFFVLAGRLGVSGAQPADVLLGALERAWSERDAAPVVDGAACGPDGCD